MAGVKGRSGRHGFYKGLDTKQLLDKSFGVMMAFLNDDTIEIEKKAHFASVFLAKRVGEKIDIEVTHQLNSGQIDQLLERLNKIQPRKVIELKP